MSTINALLANASAPSLQKLDSLDSARGFASDIVRRAQVTQSKADGKTNPSDASHDAIQQKSFALRTSLENTIGYITSEHGRTAAAAAMGIIYKRLGSESATELSLGDALLDVTRFIDANFGFDKGDDFVRHLNADLNNSLNDLFENGKNEIFITTTTHNGQTSLTSSSVASLDASGILRDTTEEPASNALRPQEIAKTIIDGIEESRRAGADQQSGPYATKTHPLPSGTLVNSMV